MQNRQNDIELKCFATDVNLNCRFLLNCSRKYRQCLYYHLHSEADGGYFKNKQGVIIQSLLKGRRLKHLLIPLPCLTPVLPYWHMFSLHGLG